MAKKKFYYAEKKKNNQSKSIEKELIYQTVTSKYSKEQLNIKIEELNLSENTRELLLNNKVLSCFDLVKRTIKDMYKIQGLNKKILFEITNALKENGMELLNYSEISNKKDQLEHNESKEKTPKKVDNKGLENKNNKKNNKIEKNNKNENKPIVNEILPLENWKKVTHQGKWGFSNGKDVVIKPQYTEVFSFREGLASVELDEKCGYIDEHNNVVIPFEYETAFSFYEGYAAVSKNGLYGYINKNNEVVFDFKFDAATHFENGEAKVKQNGKWGTLTLDGNIKWI